MSYKEDIYYDDSGKPWVRAMWGEVPSYNVPKNTYMDISNILCRQYEKHTIIQEFVVILPFKSYPMWLKDEKYVKSPTDFLCCHCVKCEKYIRNVARLCIVFTVGYIQSKYSISWRGQLSCCDELHKGVSMYTCLLYLEEDLKRVFSSAIKTFNVTSKIPGLVCYSCGSSRDCDNDICKYLNTVLHLQVYICKLLQHFKNEKLNVLSPLCEKMCEYDHCDKQQRNLYCKNCRRVVYCSKKCKQSDKKNHTERGCIEYLKVWTW